MSYQQELFEVYRGLAVKAGDSAWMIYGPALKLNRDVCIEQALLALARAVKKIDPNKPSQSITRFVTVCIEGDLSVWARRQVKKHTEEARGPSGHNDISDVLANTINWSADAEGGVE